MVVSTLCEKRERRKMKKKVMHHNVLSFLFVGSTKCVGVYTGVWIWWIKQKKGNNGNKQTISKTYKQILQIQKNVKIPYRNTKKIIFTKKKSFITLVSSSSRYTRVLSFISDALLIIAVMLCIFWFYHLVADLMSCVMCSFTEE